MDLLTRLQNNKGTVSSALGKELALEVVNGDHELLQEAIVLINYQTGNKKAKGVRAGAAKIIEKVAEQQPELVAPHAEQLLEALKHPEAQTRWMAINTLGLCAHLNGPAARKARTFAQSFYEEKSGVCLSGATSKYLGMLGALSPKEATASLNTLLSALEEAQVNEVDWILEGLMSLAPQLKDDQKELVRNTVNVLGEVPKNSTKKRIKKLNAML